jgi:S-adenosylmethionine synthetase
MADYIFTSESVSEGHPDKVCDTIADTILDAALTADPRSRVAIEVLCKEDQVVLAGELSTSAPLDAASRAGLAREAIRAIGYTEPDAPFSADGVRITDLVSRQANEISRGVDGGVELGAGDQGIMFGFASDETPEFMPLPILLAHRLTRELAGERRNAGPGWLRPDSKSQVSVRYAGGRPVEVTDVVISTQHGPEVALDDLREWITGDFLPRVLGAWHHPGLRTHVNPAGTFVQGGPSADAGVTGRKIIVDTYGGMGRHGGGAFSGKDASKVDRSGAYFCRWVARQVLKEGLARRVEVQVSYAIGRAEPVSVHVDTFGTGEADRVARFVEGFDFRPGAMIERLDLLRPVFRTTTNYGHFGRAGFAWEG